MAFGILEPKHGEVAPGTVILSHQTPTESSVPSSKEHSQNRGIVLVPQPSDSPNDPLNWPQWKKDFILLIISLQSSVVGAYGPMLGPGFVEISSELSVSVNEISQATSYLVLACGLGLFISNPLAKCFGKRPVYLACGVILCAASIWGAATEGYGSFLGSRLVGGLGMGPYEVLVQCTIGDMYFVHERATRLAFWGLFLTAGISAGPIVSAYIIQYAGYRWALGACAIFFAVLTGAFFFFAPETAFIRFSDTRADTAGGGEGVERQRRDVQDVEKVEVEFASASPRLQSSDSPPTPPVQAKEPYWRTLRVYSGRYSNASFLRIMTRPFILFFYPPMLWAFLTWGTTITFTIAFGYVNGVLFTAEPYNMSTSQVGLTNVSPLVQSIIAQVVSGPVCDWIVVTLTKHNRSSPNTGSCSGSGSGSHTENGSGSADGGGGNGTYEPEYRLVLISVGFILGITGFYGYALTVHYQTHWAGPVITYGMVNASLAFVSTCVFGYIIDAYKEVGEEAFVAINARNFLSFGILYFVNAWLERDGVLEVFVVLGSMFVFTSLLTVPMWVFGKRIRAGIHRIEWLEAYMKD